MSEPVLERSVLERKERDELQTIAKALGAKATSRAKKADLVDLILTTAGVSTPAAVPAESKAVEAKAADPADAPAPAPARNGEERAEARTNGDSPEREGDQREAREPREPREPRDRQGGGQQREDRGDRPQQDRQQQDRQPQDRGNQQGGGRQWDDDAEPGNRRGRRRRGRDRDRQGGGGGGNQQQGQRDDRPEEPYTGEPIEVQGLLDLRSEGYGFLRTKGYLPTKEDCYVSVKQARQLGLRSGDHIVGAMRPAGRNEKNPALLRIDKVNMQDPALAASRPRFEDLTPLFPDEKLRLETPGMPQPDMTTRIVDLIAPIGKGQRGLIVSPPKAGKTTVVKQIVKSIEANNPEVHLMVLLVDERPEEVTDMRRLIQRGEVIASTFDRPSDEHTAIAELTIERAKRLVEYGKDVVIMLDGITRLARAYNLAAPATGRIMSGGVDSGALYPPKRFFGAARNIEEGGSLTILATALVDTGSKMDEVIFEEFKGTGNMELRLDRKLAERRIYPAIDVDASSTRHEELLFDRKQLQQIWRVRRALSALSSDGATNGAALERLLDGMKQFKSNDEFLAEAAKVGAAATA